MHWVGEICCHLHQVVFVITVTHRLSFFVSPSWKECSVDARCSFVVPSFFQLLRYAFTLTHVTERICRKQLLEASAYDDDARVRCLP